MFVLDETAPGVEHVGDSTFYPLPEGYEDATVVTAEVAADLGVDSVGAISNQEAKALRRSLADNPKVQVSTTEDDAAARLEMSSPLTDASISATAWTSFFVPPGGAYGLWAQRNTAVFPIGDIRQPYTWQMHPASNAQVCGQGIGWYRGYNGGSFGTWSAAYNLGCGATGTGTVVWDNVIAYPKFRAKASYTLISGQGKFI